MSSITQRESFGGNKKISVRFLSFSQFHNKRPVSGSTHIRVSQLIKYWEEADLYKYGENPDVLIFQKVYCNVDYKFPTNFEGIKILDLCDPDWIDGAPIKETVDAVDAVTCSSQAIADFIKQLTDKPVVHIPDRFDVTVIPPIKKHTEKAKRIIWFGYRHNADLLKPLIKYLPELNLELLVVSNDDPLVWSYHEPSKPFVKYKKYQEETIYGYLKSADFAVFPNGARPNDKFKSNNKTVKAILAGIPVATTIDEVRAFIQPEARQQYINTKYGIIYKEYDVKKSVEQYKELIDNWEELTPAIQGNITE